MTVVNQREASGVTVVCKLWSQTLPRVLEWTLEDL